MGRDLMTQVFELTGEAGFINHDLDSPEYNEVLTRFITMPSREFADFVDVRKRVVDKSGSVVNWAKYIRHNKGDDYKRKKEYNEYLRSDAWKRKKEAVMARANQPCWPQNPTITIAYDSYGRRVESINVDWRPICELQGCRNIAVNVHHKHYDTVGKESLEDLVALCRDCHEIKHNIRTQQKR